ncbi:zf-HC2 domain-containing protein [Galactobacter valiniphilus]|uniref:zf-HC2 domain-containing protein n=1 Tax=Galactobacter valiniphilus TaxID=2676122 RepID=UPI003735C726
MVFTSHFTDQLEVAEFVADELPERRSKALEAHLERCPACRDAAADERRRVRRRATMAAAGGEVLTDTGSVALVGTRRRRMVSNAVPTIGALLTVVAFVAVLVAAWNAGGSHARADLTASVAAFSASGTPLSDYDIAELRRAGWTCPDLRPNGLTMTSSSGAKSGDLAWVSITYTGEQGAVVLTETRSLAAGAGTPAAKPELDAQQFAGGSARFALHSGLDAKAAAALQSSISALAAESAQDAQAEPASGWDRLSRGFVRLVDPTR